MTPLIAIAARVKSCFHHVQLLAAEPELTWLFSESGMISRRFTGSMPSECQANAILAGHWCTAWWSGVRKGLWHPADAVTAEHCAIKLYSRSFQLPRQFRRQFAPAKVGGCVGHTRIAWWCYSYPTHAWWHKDIFFKQCISSHRVFLLAFGQGLPDWLNKGMVNICK